MKKNPEKEKLLNANQTILTYNKLTKDQEWVSKQNENCGMFIHTVEQSQIKTRKLGDEEIDCAAQSSEDEDELKVTTIEELMDIPEFRLFG
jgi:hypothetical protein